MSFDVTLTFDNGPEPDVTPHVLETLRHADIRASFFMLGQKLASSQGQGLAERVAADGHWIGNHTYSHSVPLGETTNPALLEAEIGRTQALIGKFSHMQRYFRPFGRGGNLGEHLLNAAAVDYLKAGSYSCVLWNAIPRDWEDTEGWVQRGVAQCLAQPWSLVVLHDLPTGAMTHLARFIDKVRGVGGVFRQDFPPQCVPLRAGVEVLPLAPYVTDASSAIE
jgi:peptidoglycan/xylan/chitin deacetylase (PgdA/CDA1 family)